MKKVLLVIAMGICLSTITYAQDYKTVILAFEGKKNYDNAKTEFEKINAETAASKPDYWLWKSRIYAELYADSALSIKYPTAGETAYESFKKYEALEKDYAKLEKDASWRPLDLIYVTSFNLGRISFDKKEWEQSFNYFDKAAQMGEIIVSKNLRKTGAKIDTLTVLYAGYAAQNAKLEKDAARYYQKVVDAKLGGKDYIDLYYYVLIHASNSKNEELFKNTLAIAKEVYPTTNWEEYEVDFVAKNYSLEQKAAMYDKEDAAGTLTATKYLYYGDMFANVKKEEKEKLDSTQDAKYQIKAAEAFGKAYDKDNSQGIAAFNAGVIYYNIYGIYDDRIRDNIRTMQNLNANKSTEKDPKKKAAADAKQKETVDAIKKLNTDLTTPLTANVDKSIDFLEKGYTVLKAKTTRTGTEKNCLNKSTDYLTNLYLYKRDKAKGKDQKAFDAYDAKVKEFDAQHNKF